MFDANDISARRYVRNIECLQADSKITSPLSRHQINSKQSVAARYNLRIFTTYIQLEIGRTIRIFSLGEK